MSVVDAENKVPFGMPRWGGTSWGSRRGRRGGARPGEGGVMEANRVAAETGLDICSDQRFVVGFGYIESVN